MQSNNQKKVNLILISGISGSGKSSFTNEIIEKTIGKKICLIDMDGYYDVLPPGESGKDWNWDTPIAFKKGIALLVNHILTLKRGETVYLPKRDFSNYCMIENAIEVANPDFIIVEGIFTLYFEELRKLADLMIYIECDDEEEKKYTL